MSQLHLLMNFPPFVDDRPVDLDTLMQFFPRWCAQGVEYGLWTRHKPRRAAELENGSVYCRWNGQILWRMPISRFCPAADFVNDIPDRWRNHTAIVTSTCIAHVEPRRIQRLRGFRYVAADDVPPDLPADGIPAVMAGALADIGVRP